MIQRRRNFTAEFKRDAVDLWENSDRTARQVEEELGLSTGILNKWKQQLKQNGAEAFPGKGRLKESDEYVRQLERELAVVTQERDILKKTIAIFSTPSRNGLR